MVSRQRRIPGIPNSNSNGDVDCTFTWMGKFLSRRAISRYMWIDWRTAGWCIARVHEELEPDVNVRPDGIVKIGIDETCYRKGHSYTTAAVNHEISTVIWAARFYAKAVLQKFCELLTPEQRVSVKVVTGDGAWWITDCVRDYFPYAKRCVDPVHAVGWVTEVLDKVRIVAWRRAQEAAKTPAVDRGKILSLRLFKRRRPIM